MKIGQSNRGAGSYSPLCGAALVGVGRFRRSRSVVVGLLILVGMVSLSCRRPAAPPPPPPPEAAPPPPPPAPSITLSANPATIEAGGATTLQWQAQNANAVEIQPGVGTVAASGNQSVTPNSSVTYTATARGPGGEASDTVRVTVNTPALAPATPPPATPTLTIEDMFRTSVQAVLFDYDRAEIRADQVARLQASARFLQENPGLQFTIGGHCDERGSQEYNLGLGDRRANAVRQFLVQQGVAESRMNTVSFGEERPVCTETTEACYQRNRRADFTLR